jgi:hypothetical protein
MAPGVAQENRGQELYMASKVVQKLQSSTGVVQGSRVVHEYTGTGIVQRYTVIGVLQLCRISKRLQVCRCGTGEQDHVLQWYMARSRTGVQVYRSSICIQGYSSTTELHGGRCSAWEKWYTCSTGVQWVQEK